MASETVHLEKDGRSASPLAAKVRGFFASDARLEDEAALINLRRMTFSSLIALPVHLSHILMFILKQPGQDPVVASWRAGVIASHAALFVIMASFAVIGSRLGRSGKVNASVKAFQYIASSVIMGAGIVIVGIDQLVTSNITPFMVVCLITGLVFYLHPLKAIAIFSASFVAFSFAMNVQKSPEILLSNKVNGLTTLALALALSMLLWNNYVVTSRQRRQILLQREELEKVNRELSEIAFFDSLTGLPNRRYFDEAVRREHGDAGSAALPTSIIEFDLDLFKDVNDKYGHVVGDAALKALAGFLSPKLRGTDLLCRYGGEEFIILLRDTDIKGAAVFAERLRGALESHIFEIEGHKVRLTASFGVMQLRKGQPLEANFYRKADEALYEAKKAGRNRVSVSAR